VRKDGSLKELQNYVFSEAPSRARRVVSSGDVIVSTVRTYLRAITSISEKYKNCIASTGFCVITPSSDVATNFLKFYVRSEYFIQKVVSISEGVSYPGTTATDISNIKLLLPNLEEQDRIALYLTKETNKYQEMIELLSKQNLFLKEYRQSLISNVVTGKIKVANL
jgi:type I restriction enzyme S subunit